MSFALKNYKNKFPNAIISDSKKYKTIDYAKFTIVEETLYSSVRPYHFLQIGRIIKRIFKKPKLIIDACAHIGGSTINLADAFPSAKIISIELRKSVFDVLQQNIAEFGFQGRVTAIHDNCIPFFKRIPVLNKSKPDFINLDPPWGGPSYTKIKKLMLTLENTVGRSVPIYEIINDIFARDSTEFVTFKAPNNFDMELFIQNVKGTIRVYPILNKPSVSKKNSITKRPPVEKMAYSYVIIKKP